MLYPNHVPVFKNASLLIVAALMVLVTTSTAAIKYAGVNLSCAEFGQNNLPSTYIEANSDVWEGWAWWAAGPWWENYMFTLEPTNLGTPSQADRAAMAILRSFIPIPSPELVLTNNQFKFSTRMGFVYQPQAAPSLTAGWTNYGSAITSTGQTVTITMPTGTGASGFYRIRVTRVP